MTVDRPLIAMEAEHGVLGALMHEPELCEVIGAQLAVEDFSEPDHAALYAMVLACHSKKIKPDSVTLAEIRAELPSGEMTIVYASDIMRNVPSTANAVRYAEIVSERARARQLYQAGQALMALACSIGSVTEQVAEAQRLVLDLNAEDDTPDVVTHTEGLGQVFADMQDRLDGKQVSGLQFGLPDLDKIINGIRPGNLAIIAGRPGTGKTVLGVGVADSVALNHGGGALIFSLEMATKELSKRSLAAASGVSQDRIDSGAAIMDGDSRVRLEAAVARMHAADVRICDKPALTFARICAIARFQHRAKPLSVIVVDYLSLIATEPNSKLNRNQELGVYSRGFKALAKSLAIPVIVLAQLNRGIETRADPKPKMSDLRDSGEIEQDADMIIMAHRDMQSERGQNGLTEIDVVKCRHARPGFCVLQFQGEYARFVSAAQIDYDPEPAHTNVRPMRKSARSMLSES
jgi:replicative DNA helicase